MSAPEESGKIQHEIGVYFVSKSNFGAGQKVGEFSDFSFLKKENFDAFVAQVKALSLTPDEIEQLKAQREKEIDLSLVRLNNDIYQNEKGLGENDRVYLVAAAIIATLGIPGKVPRLKNQTSNPPPKKATPTATFSSAKSKHFWMKNLCPKRKKS